MVEFNKQVIQIAALGAWQMVTGKTMQRRLEQVDDPRWNETPGLFITLRKDGKVRGNMGLLESTTTLPETLFDVGGAAATHDSRFPALEESELADVIIEVTLISQARKLDTPDQIQIGKTGLIISRGENRGVLLPQTAEQNKWSREQFLEACCEKAKLSHKAWKDPNTLVEIFESQTLIGKAISEEIADFI